MIVVWESRYYHVELYRYPGEVKPWFECVACGKAANDWKEIKHKVACLLVTEQIKALRKMEA